MGSEEEVALYYPYIDITDASLIKTVALYWDKLQTIVPESIKDPYQSPSSVEAAKQGFLKSRCVNSQDTVVKQAREEFREDLRSKPIYDHMMSLIIDALQDATGLHTNKWAPASFLKIWHTLNDGLKWTPVEDEYFSTVPYPDEIGHAYMSRLASVVAQKDRAAALTNVSYCQNMLLDRFLDYAEERKRNQSQLANLSFQTIVVNPDVPLIDILRFRDRHRKELINYRKHIRKLVRGISKGLNTFEKQSLFEEMVKNEFLPVKEEVEAKLAENADWFMKSNMAIMIAVMGAILSSGGRDWLAKAIQGSVALGINYLGNIREDRKCVKNHPVGYLYQAQKKFGVNK